MKHWKDNKTSHEDFTTIINEEKNSRESIESFTMENSQRSDAGNINLIEEGKKIDTDEIIKLKESNLIV